LTGSQRTALDLAGVARSTWQYRNAPRPKVATPVPQKERDYLSRISAQDRALIEGYILTGWAQHNSVDHSFAAAWDDGVMLASQRMWWRIAEEIEDQMLRPKIATKHTKRTGKDAPVLKATAPNQVWSWDITDLYSPWRGITFKAYKIIDIYSRKVVGWRVEDREVDQLAVEMFAETIATWGAPQFVHSDSGAAMTSNALYNYLGPLGITITHNRPYTSNDNPFSEAGFRTMKYRPDYPRIFTDLDAARAYLTGYVTWYNTSHRHSGIALFTPDQVHDGSWRATWAIRDNALQRYYQAHPERFHAKPTTPAPADTVGINLPKKEENQPH